MTRLSDEINQGLRIKDSLYEKIERVSAALINRLQKYLQANGRNFKDLKKISHHFIDGGFSDTSSAIFVFSNGWKLELTNGNHVHLKNDKLLFHVRTGDWNHNNYSHPVIESYPNSVTHLYELDNAFDSLLKEVGDTFEPLQKWMDDLKYRNIK